MNNSNENKYQITDDNFGDFDNPITCNEFNTILHELSWHESEDWDIFAQEDYYTDKLQIHYMLKHGGDPLTNPGNATMVNPNLVKVDFTEFYEIIGELATEEAEEIALPPTPKRIRKSHVQKMLELYAENSWRCFVGEIGKGHMMDGRYGWVIPEFGKNTLYLGKTLEDAYNNIVDWIFETQDNHKQQKAYMKDLDQ